LSVIAEVTKQIRHSRPRPGAAVGAETPITPRVVLRALGRIRS
jgi:hypothetical protein